MRTAIEWRRNLAGYLACCDCGATELHLRLTEAEQWALTHQHEGETMNERTIKRPPWVEDALGVWDDQGPYPLRNTEDVGRLVAWVRTLEQRNQAAQAHIDRARAHLDDWRATELVTALDILRGEATA